MAKRNTSFTPLLLTLLLLGLVFSGCEDDQSQRDARLHAANQAALEAQRQQNQLVAAQSQALAENSREITAAAGAVLAREHEIRSQLDQQQQRIDAGRTDLENQRQLLAQQRQRDPVIAAAIQSVGLWLACTTPLLFGLYALRLMFRDDPQHAAVAELLVTELVSDSPRLLTAPVMGPLRIERQTPPVSHLPDDRPDDAPF
jgi:hypothetical protein